ncbi:MAG: FtsQ-type POTRA domain-containing protein [Cyanobacteria bacterium]|nr:FtsQ-type POTRA domain-containing protein [Cyanobacteriota bacterium]MDA1246222.1 FtsQ-type POTRA domain-containing protein [Cyanobacteriota bacterium]
MRATPAQPGSERRRQLREQRRRDRLSNLWRFLVLLALAGGLGYSLLRQGWVLTGPEQVVVVGSQQVETDQVVQAAGLTFPQRLLELHPKRIAEALASALPVEQVQVNRLMAPPRLRIELVDRQAVASAQRRTTKGSEQGYIDRLGNWMSISQGKGGAVRASTNLQVLGWQTRYRPALALVLEQQGRLGGDISQIRFEPDSSLWLVSKRLGKVRLGLPDGKLERRLEVLRHLQQVLPAKVKGRQLQSIDLSDPEQPELGLPNTSIQAATSSDQ